MEITDIRIRKVDPAHNQKMKAVVSITFDDMFVVHDIKIIDGGKGLFVDMPCRKAPNGEYKDIAHPISRAARQMIQAQVLEAFRKC